MIKTKKSVTEYGKITKTFSFTVIADNAERCFITCGRFCKMIVRYMQAATSDYQVRGVYYKL